MRKIKLFLAAYINFPNAQNVNCEHIARYIDKEKFEVHTMYTDRMSIDKAKYETMGIHLHKLIHHRFIWYWSKLWQMKIADCDIYYMPKIESMDCVFAKWYKGKKKFCSSVEGVITEVTNNSQNFRDYYTVQMDGSFAISKCVQDSVKKYWNFEMPVIPLGVDSVDKCKENRDTIRQIIWVGNVKANKRPHYLIDIAKVFPSIQFLMIGDGDMMQEISNRIRNENIKNVSMLGRVPNKEVYDYMKSSDLLLMTSEFEGLPKVIQEAALNKVPSIYMAQNYKVDFIEDGVNGFEAYSVEQMKEQIQQLIDNPACFIDMSQEAYLRIQPYLWKNVIHQYEDFFISVLKQ